VAWVGAEAAAGAGVEDGGRVVQEANHMVAAHTRNEADVFRRKWDATLLRTRSFVAHRSCGVPI